MDYYEVGLKDNHKKVTYMLSKDIFNNLFIDSEDCIIVDIDKLFKMQFLTAYASVNQNNMSNHVLEGRNNLISESFVPLNVLTESSVALYGLDCFENTELSNSFIQEHFKKYNMKVIMDTFNIEKEDREVESLVNEFIKDIKVDIDICNLLKLKINLLNNVIQILGSQSVVFELKEDNGKFAVFNKDKNSHINLYEIFQHLLFNRFSEKEDYFENLEVNIQHNLMKTENLLLKSKVKGNC